MAPKTSQLSRSDHVQHRTPSFWCLDVEFAKLKVLRKPQTGEKYGFTLGFKDQVYIFNIVTDDTKFNSTTNKKTCLNVSSSPTAAANVGLKDLSAISSNEQKKVL